MKTFRKCVSLVLAIASLCWLMAWISLPGVAGMDNASNGLIQMPSQFDVAETGDRFEALLQERMLTLFSRIDHAQNAASVNQQLRDTQLFIFGNPNVGTPLMQCDQTVAIDLPQKVLIWQDESDQVWLAYNDPQYLMERHQLTGCEPVIERVSQVLNGFAVAATQG
ncbi:MAG: DUF302 domain-containing protein [Leptolyngbya sp. SIO1D8]|nr:DUF302 domain-containing protein [Leptolyngbya sp. SIO1D8]